MSVTRSFSVDPSYPIECCGAVFIVASFTDESYFPFTQMQKERSRMTRYSQILWGMQASGETLSVGGSLPLIVLYLIIFANSLCTLVCSSEHRSVLSSVELADMWGACRIDATVCSVYHAGPHFTGYPSVENDCRRGFVLW